jgi:intracellular multiplication protein IcmJ
VARLPLVLSAHISAWNADPGQGAWEMGTDGADPCHYCGQATGCWRGSPPSIAQSDKHVASVHMSCPLCELPLNLNRADIDREAVLIWLPEMAQAVLNILVREIHINCFQTGIAPTFGDGSHVKASLAATPAIMAYRTLHERSASAELRIGTASPRQLAVALLALKAADYERRAALMGSLRLLSLGRFFRGGHDVYPEILCTWAKTGSVA